MKTRQFLIAAATSLVVASPVFAASGSYGEGSMWTDLTRDATEYSSQSFVATSAGGVQQVSEVGIYEQLAAFQRKTESDNGQGVAGPSGPTLASADSQIPAYQLRTDASIYEQVAYAQRDMGHF